MTLEINLLKTHCGCGCGDLLDRISPFTKSLVLRSFLPKHCGSGPKARHWKGGRITLPSGYVLVYSPDHPDANADGYIREHRLIAESIVGRRLYENEVVHHKDGNRSNNALDNLEVCKSVAHHNNKHKKIDLARREPDAPNPIIECACGCGGRQPMYDSDNRPRKFMHGHNNKKGKL